MTVRAYGALASSLEATVWITRAKPAIPATAHIAFTEQSLRKQLSYEALRRQACASEAYRSLFLRRVTSLRAWGRTIYLHLRADSVALAPQTRGDPGLAAADAARRRCRLCRPRQDFAAVLRVAGGSRFVVPGRDSGDDSPRLPR